MDSLEPQSQRRRARVRKHNLVPKRAVWLLSRPPKSRARQALTIGRWNADWDKGTSNDNAEERFVERLRDPPRRVRGGDLAVDGATGPTLTAGGGIEDFEGGRPTS